MLSRIVCLFKGHAERVDAWHENDGPWPPFGAWLRYEISYCARCRARFRTCIGSVPEDEL